MGKRIIIEPNEVWDYCEQYFDTLEGSAKLIADNIITGAQVFIAVYSGIPTILACVDCEEVDEEPCANEEDCTETAARFYENFLSDDLDMTGFNDEALQEYEITTAINEREIELNDIMYDMLEQMVPNILDVTDDIVDVCDDLVDYVCEFLYRNHGISVYRPMYLECEDGSEEFCKFPYGEMDYDED